MERIKAEAREKPKIESKAGIKLERIKVDVNEKKAEKCKVELKPEKKEERKTVSIGGMNFPEPLPLKKPSEREWEAVGKLKRT